MGEQSFGQSAAAGTDLYGKGGTFAARGFCDPFESFAFDEEVLAESLSQFSSRFNPVRRCGEC
jgi:hypothetical protein